SSRRRHTSFDCDWSSDVCSSDLTWRVNEIRIRRGDLRFNDRSPAKQSGSLAGIDLTLHDFDATRMQGQLAVREINDALYHAQDQIGRASCRKECRRLGATEQLNV